MTTFGTKAMYREIERNNKIYAESKNLTPSELARKYRISERTVNRVISVHRFNERTNWDVFA